MSYTVNYVKHILNLFIGCLRCLTGCAYHAYIYIFCLAVSALFKITICSVDLLREFEAIYRSQKR